MEPWVEWTLGAVAAYLVCGLGVTYWAWRKPFHGRFGDSYYEFHVCVEYLWQAVCCTLFWVFAIWPLMSDWMNTKIPSPAEIEEQRLTAAERRNVPSEVTPLWDELIAADEKVKD